MPAYRVLDIETVPDESVWTRPAPRFAWKVPEQSFEDIRYGGLRPPFLEQEEQFPPPQAHRVVAISFVNLTDEDGRFYCQVGTESRALWSGSDLKAAEKQLLAWFSEIEATDEAMLVTWNGRCFDLPVINLRSFHHGIPLPWYYRMEGMRYRYSESGHCDLMDLVTDYGAARNIKLGDMARVMGLPGKQGEVTGSNVSQIVKRGDDSDSMLKVADYCLSDSLQTALLFIRTRYHKGMISAVEYNRAVDSFADCEAFSRLLPTVQITSLKVSI